jgi:lipid-binding SYLF domain-containing protein
MPAQTKPDPTTMEGMICNANKVLDRALSPETNGVHRGLFEKAKGIVLISSIEAGFIFSGNLGTGILMAKDKAGKWSPPSALGLTGVGWGFIVGASTKDLMVFLFDEQTIDAMAGEIGLKVGGQAELTVGPWGRTVDANLNISNGGIGSTFTVAYTKGFFGGVSIEGAVLGTRKAVNETFYNSTASSKEILFEGTVEVPADNTVMPEVYRKLELLSQGKTAAESNSNDDVPVKSESEPELNSVERNDDVPAKAESEPELNSVGSNDDAPVKAEQQLNSVESNDMPAKAESVAASEESSPEIAAAQ